MSKQERRRWTAQQKLSIVEEARTGGKAVGEVCRKHQIAPQVFYEWERKIREGSLQALAPRAREIGKSRSPTRTLGEAESEIARLKGIIAEIAEENVTIKKGLWP